jgi:hypothetical protein
LTGTLTLSNNLTAIPSDAFKGDSGLTGSLILPDSITSIAENAFYDCGFTGTLSLPENPSLTTLGASVFTATQFTSVTIPNNITALGSRTFAYCTSLVSIICDYEIAPSLSGSADAFRNASATGTVTNIDPYSHYSSDELCTLLKSKTELPAE